MILETIEQDELLSLGKMSIGIVSVLSILYGSYQVYNFYTNYKNIQTKIINHNGDDI